MKIGPFEFFDGAEIPRPYFYKRGDGKLIFMYREREGGFSIGLYRRENEEPKSALCGWNGLDQLTATAVVFHLLNGGEDAPG